MSPPTPTISTFMPPAGGPMTAVTDVHIAAIEYALPDCSAGLDDLAKDGKLTSPPEVLRSFGFEQAWIAGSERDQLASRAVTLLVENAKVDPASIDVLFYAAAAAGSHAAGTGVLAGFSYPAARLQYEFGFANARVVGVSQAGCLGLMSAVNLARAMLVADPSVQRVLCVSSDVLPEGMGREILFNLISDGACAMLLERGPGPNRLIAERQITKGYYWDCDARANEIVAAYFPTARTIIHHTLEASGQSVDGLALVVPHNVSKRSWDILLRLTGLPPDRLYTDNIASKAHVISGDNFINLKDAAAAGKLHPGDRVLLFNFGFGASWACLLLEH